jgi:hypothetical protein
VEASREIRRLKIAKASSCAERYVERKAIAQEADTIANLAGAELLELPTDFCRDALRARVIAEMTDALVVAGDTYTAPDGVRYSLVADPTERRLG